MNYKTTEQNSTVNLPEQNSTASSPENNSTGPVVSQPVCRDFNRGYCPRGDHCRRIHTTAICWMYLRDSESCNASNCAFVHKSMSDILEMEESEAVTFLNNCSEFQLNQLTKNLLVPFPTFADRFMEIFPERS